MQTHTRLCQEHWPWKKRSDRRADASAWCSTLTSHPSSPESCLSHRGTIYTTFSTTHDFTAICPPSCGTLINVHCCRLITFISAPRADLWSPDMPTPTGQAGQGGTQLVRKQHASQFCCSPCTHFCWSEGKQPAWGPTGPIPLPFNASLFTTHCN